MGKLSKRKQTITIMDKRGAGAAINLGEYLSLLLPLKVHIDPSSYLFTATTEGAVHKLIYDISCSPSLKEQMALLQAAKQQLKPQIMVVMQHESMSSLNESISTNIYCLVVLLVLYLLPVTLPLRKSLDWVFDFIAKDHEKVDPNLQTEIIREVNRHFCIPLS